MISDWKLNSQIQNYKKGRTDSAEKKIFRSWDCKG